MNICSAPLLALSAMYICRRFSAGRNHRCWSLPDSVAESSLTQSMVRAGPDVAGALGASWRRTLLQAGQATWDSSYEKIRVHNSYLLRLQRRGKQTRSPAAADKPNIKRLSVEAIIRLQYPGISNRSSVSRCTRRIHLAARTFLKRHGKILAQNGWC
jgi:hypothetical protein